MTDLDQVAIQYELAYGVPVPIPFGVSDEKLVSVLHDALTSGQPIPDNFDWYDDLPDGADA